MDQDKTTVMGGYGSPRTGSGADTTRVVPNPGYAAPDATQVSADPTRVVNYGNAPQDPYGVSSQSPYGNAVADPYDDLLQNPIPQPQQTTYMPRTAQPRYESRDRYAREPYREYPKSIPQYGEDEEKKPSRSSSVIKKILIVLAIFFALSVVFAIVSGMLNKRGATTDTATGQTETAQSATVDLSDIPGQYWSNAKKLLKSRGADLSNAVILTDDGSTPVVDATRPRSWEIKLSSWATRLRISATPRRTWATWQRTPGTPCKTAFRAHRGTSGRAARALTMQTKTGRRIA